MSDYTEKTYPAAEMRHEIVTGSPDVVLQKRQVFCLLLRIAAAKKRLRLLYLRSQCGFFSALFGDKRNVVSPLDYLVSLGGV